MIDFNKIKNINVDQLKRKDLGGSNLDFQGVNKTLEIIKANILFLEGRQFTLLTDFQQEQIRDFSAVFQSLCQEI